MTQEELKELIIQAADAAAHKAANAVRVGHGVDLYRTTEWLLRTYPVLKEQLDDYEFAPKEKSKDISVAPPKGSGVRDKMEIADEALEARKTSYLRTLSHFNDIESMIKPFRDDPYFYIIRMYYFGEDYSGNRTGRQATFEEIADELHNNGIDRSIKTLRSKRTKLVQRMCVAQFAVDGALSLEEMAALRGSRKADDENDG